MRNDLKNGNVLRDRTIMVVMPHPWKGGFFRVAAVLCNILDEIDYKGLRFHVILGVPPGYDCTEKYLLNPNVSIEQVGYETVSNQDTRFVSPQSFDRLKDLPLITPYRTLPYGDTTIIGEVDAYVLLSALFFEGVFVSRKPYAVYVADLIQRYVPAIYSDAGSNYSAPPWKMDRNQRAALKEAVTVFSTTPQTLNDVHSYGGVSPNRTMLFPMFAIDISEEESSINTFSRNDDDKFTVIDKISGKSCTILKDEYFLWVTNASAHKNHINAFKALRHYYENLGGQLTCLACGPVTDMLIPGPNASPYHKKVHAELEGWPEFNSHIKLLGYLSDTAYLRLLKNAHFLWHNVIYDNGTFSILEAASVGTPTLSSRYPQIEYMDQIYKTDAVFFDPHDPIDAAKALVSLEASAIRREPQRIGHVNRSELRSSIYNLLDKLFLTN